MGVPPDTITNDESSTTCSVFREFEGLCSVKRETMKHAKAQREGQRSVSLAAECSGSEA